MAEKKILVPVDFSELTDELIAYAGEFAKLLNARIILLHIIQSTQLVEILGSLETGIPSLSDPELIEQVRHSAKAKLEGYKRGLVEKGIEVESEVLAGVPYLEIAQFAIEKDVDLIIIASHGRSGWRHFLLGSVAEKVAKKSKVPVLIYKPRLAEETRG